MLSKAGVKKIVISLGALLLAMGVSFVVIGGLINLKTRFELRTGLRKFPYPYKAALAISSDIDNTDSLREFLEIQKFLNTHKNSSIGRGVGLEISNSVFMYGTKDNFAYFNNDKNKEVITDLIQAGYVDTLHAWGSNPDKPFTREYAKAAIEELKSKNNKIHIWVDHSYNLENFGNNPTDRGDDVGDIFYHADITRDFGVKYVWIGAMTGRIGQNRSVKPVNLYDVLDMNPKSSSVYSVLKSVAKICLGFFGDERYWEHVSNDLVTVKKLGDGQKIYEFVRFNNNPNGVWEGANSQGLAYQLSNETLQTLVENKGYMVIYTHLGINENCSQFIAQQTQEALRKLEKFFRKKEILVTTSSRVLNYNLVYKGLQWTKTNEGGKSVIKINKVQDPVFGDYVPSKNDLRGMTFYCKDPKNTRIFIGEEEVANLQINPADETGQTSLTISWDTLTFPATFPTELTADK